MDRVSKFARQQDFTLLFLGQTLTIIRVLVDRHEGCNAIISGPRVVPQMAV